MKKFLEGGGRCALVWGLGKDFPGPVRSGRRVPEATALVRCSGLRWPDPLQKQAPLQPRQVPRGEVFRPHRRQLEHLEPVDFLGKAKVRGQRLTSCGRGARGASSSPQVLSSQGHLLLERLP